MLLSKCRDFSLYRRDKIKGKRRSNTNVNAESSYIPCCYAPFLGHPRTAPEQSKRSGVHHKSPKTVTWAPENDGDKVKQVEDMGVLEQRRLQKLKKAGIKVLPAAVRYNRSGWTGMSAAAAAAAVVVDCFVCAH